MRKTPAGLLLLAALAGPGLALAAQPVTVQPGVAQMFVDDLLIAYQAKLVRTLHQPTKDEGGNKPVIASPEHTSLLAYGSIVFDAKLKRQVMFVQEFPSRQMYRLTSADGMTWDKGPGEPFEKVAVDLDLGEIPRDKAKNSAGHRNIDLFSCFYDTADAQHPYKAWVWYSNYGNDHEGIFYCRSGDGLKWERVRQVVNGFAGPGDESCQVIEQDGKKVYGPGDVTVFTHDPVSGRFLGIFKFFTPDEIGPTNGIRSRTYMWLDRIDEPVDTKKLQKMALLPAVDYRNGDTPFDEYYASTAYRYESLWLGSLKIYHSRGDYAWSEDGCAFLKLAVSRDAINWAKVPYLSDAGMPEVWIPNGKQGGNNGQNDGGYISDFSTPPLRVGNELIYYYSASAWGKNRPASERLMGGGIFRARLRPDGFVSVDEGVLTTQPLAGGTGKGLTVNGIGPIAVEALDAHGKPLASTELEGDNLAHPVKSPSPAAPAPVTLRFTVKPPGKLYSFTLQ